MKRVVLVLVSLGILGLASGNALADNYRGSHSGWGYNGHYRPYHHAYYAPPRVVVRPPVFVPSYPAYRSAYPLYQSLYQPWGYDPCNNGLLQIYPRGLSLWFGF